VASKKKELEDRLKLMLKEDVITKYQYVSFKDNFNMINILIFGLIGNEIETNQSECSHDRRSS